MRRVLLVLLLTACPVCGFADTIHATGDQPAMLAGTTAVADGDTLLPAEAPCELAKLTASDGSAGDELGRAVAIDGDTIVFGVERDDDAGLNSGSVYIFILDGADWTEDAKLTAGDAAAEDYFGQSVAISGDYLVIGAPYDDDAGTDSGSAYVFSRSGTTWTEEAKLNAVDGAEGDRFGISVDISGNDIVVGAHLDDDNDYNSGSAYVFSRSGTVWTEEAKLTASDGSFDDQFGFSVGISNDHIIVGAPLDDDDALLDTGSAYIFSRSDTVWTEEAKCTAGTEVGDAQFGCSVAIDGDHAVIGALWDSVAGINTGSAYVFSRSGRAWTEEDKLTASDGEGSDFFGFSVAISGDRVVVGAHLNSSEVFFAGAAYLFSSSGTVWSEEAKLTASDWEIADLFGWSVTVSNDHAVVGATRDDDAGENSGSAYLFGVSDASCGTVDAQLSCVPASGTVPFVTQMTATLSNIYTGQLRRITARINLTLGGGGYFASWRSGFTNLSPGESYVTSWNQSLPALGALIGDNVFSLVAEDVTPAPYNQPPYPPAGDTETVSCTVTGIEP